GEGVELLRQGDPDAAEFALIAEAKIDAIGELKRGMLKTHRRGVMVHDEEASGHSQMDHERKPGVKRKDQVVAAPVGAGDRAIDQAPTRVDSGWSFENLRKCRIDLDGRDRLVDDMRGDQGSDGFDFGKLWHT